MQQLALKFANSLPRKPYCSDDFSLGLQILSKHYAKFRRYIQHNHVNSLAWLVFDIDHATHPKEPWHELDLPAPNFFVQNRENSHAHIFYLLDQPIHLNPDSSQKAINYALAIQQAMTRELKADFGYSGLISKNPLCNDWLVVVNHDHAYSLDELAEYLKTLNLRDAKRAVEKGLGFGRNLGLFNDLRRYAYVDVRKFKNGAYNAFYDSILTQGVCLNSFFKIPLDIREVQHIVKSISKWVWHRRIEFCYHREEWLALQMHRGKKGGLANGQRNEEKRLQAIKMLEYGLTKREIAQKIQVTDRTLRNWLKKSN
jgi:hypothetical protein